MATTETDNLEEERECRICLGTDRRGIIAPCLCRGTSKYVHRECLDQWRSTREGFAFAHCTTCKARYHLRVNSPVNSTDRKRRNRKFHLLVARDVLCCFVAVQLVVVLLAYLVSQISWLPQALRCNFSYYLCGAVLFLALSGLCGLCITCFNSIRTRADNPREERPLERDQRRPTVGTGSGNTSSGSQRSTSSGESSTSSTSSGSESSTSSGGDSISTGEALIMVLMILVMAVIGLFYLIHAVMEVWHKIWRRHYHILEKRMLTKEYVVVDVDGLANDSNWSAPPLAPEHVKELRELGLW